ncbi:MAG: class I SAM-dependent rRNA methyltransferase [Lachnospiraceae bacterium]|nr:class I SAM-dependent rRNA methyltransferase [Lachnospiraceae bacterium]
MERDYPVVNINKKAEKLLRSGHPWVYGEETEGPFGPYENGDIVDVVTEKGSWMGAGFINDNSKIRVRLISRNTNDRFDEAFWRRRVRYAIDYRKAVMGEDFHCCRLIFGEADTFPGVTVDLFEDVLVTEILSLGMECIKPMLYRLLVEELAKDGIKVNVIYERNEAAIRTKEGMELQKGFFQMDGLKNDTDGHVTINENGILYDVDYINGQKTGFFLDQKYNRLAAAKMAPGRRVLDCFTHTGSFALNCAKAGASHVKAIDISGDAIALAKKNAALNGLEGNMSFLKADVFDLLTEMANIGKKEYDFIILDPPAFTKSRATVRNAYNGYKEINMKAMKLLPRGGYLATCSCSHFMSADLFRQMLADAAKDAGVSLRQIEERRQSPDHPILWGVPETEYLKFYIFQVV